MDQTLEFIKGAYTGPNGVIYIALNIIAIFGHRVVGWSQTWVLVGAAAVGGFMGGLGGFVTTLSDDGIASAVILNATFAAAIIGCASSIAVGWGLSSAADKLGLPISKEKTHAEKLRDPLDPTMPAPEPKI